MSIVELCIEAEMEPAGFEPAASRMQTDALPTELWPLCLFLMDGGGVEP